jgi:3-isopropylmalate dehydratase small subunit
VPFEIDHEIQRRLLDGLDDIGVTLSAEASIADFEGARETGATWEPVPTTGL